MRLMRTRSPMATRSVFSHSSFRRPRTRQVRFPSSLCTVKKPLCALITSPSIKSDILKPLDYVRHDLRYDADEM